MLADVRGMRKRLGEFRRKKSVLVYTYMFPISYGVEVLNCPSPHVLEDVLQKSPSFAIFNSVGLRKRVRFRLARGNTGA